MKTVLASFLILWATWSIADTRAAFVVGNSAYENAPALSNPVRDARLVADTLRQLDFEVTRHEDLTRDGFADALGDFLRTNRDADVNFFYFAGHGMQFDGKNYLVGTDAELRSELDIDSETIELDKVVDLLERNSKAALIFVDACRDNPLATDFYRRNYSETRALETRGLARVRSRTDGSMLVFAAGPGQVAYDGAGRNSPFATALARHLPTEGAEVLSLTKRIIGDVRDATEGRQSPIVTNDLTQEIFLREAALRPENNSSWGQTELDTEKQIFEAADKVATHHGWARYFEMFPNGRLRSLALDKEHEVLRREISHLAADWDVSPKDFEVTNQLAARFEARLGLDRNDAIAIQALLKRRGHYTRELDGDLGPSSRAALREFQTQAQLPTSGIVTRATAAALGIKINELVDHPSFSSHRKRIIPLEAAKLLKFDERLVKVLETARGIQAIYGYRGERLYIASNSPSIAAMHWTRDASEASGRYLVSINSEEENRWVYELVRYERLFWRLGGDTTKMYFGPSIGLIQDKDAAEPRGGWHWASGETTDYQAWDRSEPNDHNNREDYAHIWILAENWRGTPDLPGGARWNDGGSLTSNLIFEIE